MLSETLKIAAAQSDTPERDMLKAGGPSSSATLRELHQAAIDDVVELDRRTRDTAEELTRVTSHFSTQLAALVSRFQGLEARLPTVEGRWLADLFTTDLLHEDNAAEVSTLYGQATLPIRSSADKLVGRDSRGTVWVPPGSLLHYSYKSTAPEEVDWLADGGQELRAIDGRSDTAWERTRASSGTVWVRAVVPARLSGSKQANALILHPSPALGFHLNSVEYRTPGGAWVSLDLTYLEGYSSAASRVEALGNVRLLFGLAPVVELRLKLTTEGAWGFREIALREVEFSTSATLSVDFGTYSPGTLTETFLYGKDQDALSYLQRTITGSQVSVQLTQSVDGQSPVVTGLEVAE